VVSAAESGRERLVRYTPESLEEWVLYGILALLFASCVGFLWRAFYRFVLRRWDSEQAQLTRDSAAFCGRWPPERLSYAPLVELEAEAKRCRRIIRIQELRNVYLYQNGHRQIRSHIAALRAWLATVNGAMNLAAEREQWPRAPYGQQRQW
jgi:hypothetical protein